MPNLAFHLEVLDLVIDKLADSDPRKGILKQNKAFAALGALGPDLLNYLPISGTLSDALAAMAGTPTPQISTLPFAQLQELFLNPVGAVYSLLFRLLVVPVWPVINQIKKFLDDADAVAAQESKIGAVSLVSTASDIQSKSQSLKKVAGTTLPQLVAMIGQIIALPPWMEQTQTFPLAPSDPKANRLGEFLRWHRTGKFGRALLQKAGNNDRLRAYALGYLCHIATSVIAEPFVNTITGGPYRTHWWRHRLVSNFIDSWTFGFFKTSATMSGDNPTPMYTAWKSLPNGSSLQETFNVGNLPEAAGFNVPPALTAMATGALGNLPSLFPQDLATMLQKTVDEIYTAQPLAGFSEDVFKQAYVGAFAVVWFMTSGSGPMGENPLGPPPATCNGATPPSWVSSGSAPSPQQAGLNPGATACAVLLAIFALFELLAGDLPGAAAALIAAFNAPIIDWDTVRCNLFWLRKTLVDAENGLREALIKGGLAYPTAAKLGTVDANGQTHPVLDSIGGVPLCRTTSLEIKNGYPKIMDATNSQAAFADLNFNAFPMVAVEEPSTKQLIPINKYPNFVVNGAGLQNGGIMVDGPFPSRGKFLGDAVANAVAVVAADAKGLPDYNLDGDRGYGWKTWHPHPGSIPATPPVQADPD